MTGPAVTGAYLAKPGERLARPVTGACLADLRDRLARP